MITRDLGLADYYHFPEDPPESAVSALNQITKDLTSKGILHIGNECAVSISGGIISVADGVCVFETGAKKRINAEDAVTVEFISGATNYVYMTHNEADNQIQLMSSLEEPTEGNFVMLAEIDADKNVLDRRYFSISKVSRGTNMCHEVNETFLFSGSRWNTQQQKRELIERMYNFNVKFSPKYCIICDSEYNSQQNNGKKIELQEGVYTQPINCRMYCYMKIKKENSKITVITYNEGNDPKTVDMTLFFT